MSKAKPLDRPEAPTGLHKLVTIGDHQSYTDAYVADLAACGFVPRSELEAVRDEIATARRITACPDGTSLRDQLIDLGDAGHRDLNRVHELEEELEAVKGQLAEAWDAGYRLGQGHGRSDAHGWARRIGDQNPYRHSPSPAVESAKAAEGEPVFSVGQSVAPIATAHREGEVGTVRVVRYYVKFSDGELIPYGPTALEPVEAKPSPTREPLPGEIDAHFAEEHAKATAAPPSPEVPVVEPPSPVTRGQLAYEAFARAGNAPVMAYRDFNPEKRACWEAAASAASPEVPVTREEPEPIPMFLTCPACTCRHIDEGEFATKRHHTHSCQECGLTWRPAVVATVGVQFLPGFKNETADELAKKAGG